MAARWGAGEETLTACNMEFFSLDTLDETAELSSVETLEALQSCLDPSILSIFEDAPSIETKGLDEESEATLLTALTEILDNVDDENLSPFDTLPESDLLSGQKGREHSPLRRMLCLSRTPQEKDTLCNARALSTGKSLPRIHTDSLQRSDGEEEEDGSLTLSPTRHNLTPDSTLLDWEGLALPLPVTFEQESDEGVSVSLGDLVRHMHPYCMTICMENDEDEQMLPEGGILLEVVDQGENGEPILAIPDMDLPVSLSLTEQSAENLQKMSDEAEEVRSESSEHIVVDDDEDETDGTPVKIAVPVTPNQCPDGKEDINTKGRKLDIKAKSPTRRKKKKASKECKPEPVESRVLRSSSVKSIMQELPKKYEKKIMKNEKKKKVPKDSLTPAPSAKPWRESPHQTETKAEITAATLTPEKSVKCATSVLPKGNTVLLNANPEGTRSASPATVVGPQQPDDMPQQMIPADDPNNPATPAASDSPTAALTTTVLKVTPSVSEPLPAAAAVVPEPKPKSLSLAEYRRLRQQKKPVPVEKQDDNSTKWPSLPELPKELPPIPCLPDPSPKDPRRPNPTTANKEVEEVRPAWQPRGPCAPPTPEALLVPPAYMVASSSKAAVVPKPQQTQELQAAKPQSPNPPVGTQSSVRTVVTTPPPAIPCVPQPKSMDAKCPTLSGDKGEGTERPQPLPVSPKSTDLRKTTTEAIKPTAATMPGPISSQRTTVSQKSPEVTAATSINNRCTSKPTTTGAQTHPSPSAHPVAIQGQKPVSVEAKEKPTTVRRPPMAKSQTQVLIESFTSEIGIEAADLTSLLEQFEETQAKEEQCVPEVSGRAAAVGNSSIELAPEKTVVERVRANDLSNTAALTPPATPPHQMWKPLAPVALLGKNKVAESSKASPAKVIQIEARPLPSIKSRSKPTLTVATIAPELACMDHDYCLPSKDVSTVEAGKRWNVKQQTFITIKPIKHPAAGTPPTSVPTAESSIHSTTNAVVTSNTQKFPSSEPLDHRTDATEEPSVLETPDASPTWQEDDAPVKEDSHRKGPFERSYRWHAATSRTPSPARSTEKMTESRGRKRRTHRSPTPLSSGSDSDSHSSRSRSRSNSPSKKRYRCRHSQSSSSSSSRSSSRSSRSVSCSPPRRRRYSYSSSRSGSWSRSRSRSRSPQRHAQWNRDGRLYSPSYRSGYSQNAKPKPEEVKRRKEKAIEERRVVYIGRIRGTMTQRELKDRFSYFGEIEECTLHFRDQGDNYGFVTYYSTKDAFTAIENGSKLRKPDELPFDLCFGGRRQFCQTTYSDLDSSREYEPRPEKGRYNALDFDTLLKQAQQNQKR